MVIRFLRDFRSAATHEAFYEAGAVADLERGGEIIAEGAAELVTIASRRGQVDPLPPPLPDEPPARGKRGRS